MSQAIEHQGIVQSVDADGVKVLIVQNSACSTCSAHSACMASESKEKIIDTLPLTDMKPGDKVKVVIQRKFGFQAVLIAFVIPFTILITIVALLSLLTQLNDAVIGSIALAALVPYYIMIALLKDKLKKQFTFYSELI